MTSVRKARTWLGRWLRGRASSAPPSRKTKTPMTRNHSLTVMAPFGAVRSRARKQAVVAQTITLPCLIPVQALRQLDVCAEWVGDVGDAGGRAGTGVAGHVELLAVGLQFLAETGEILNLKADMIEPAAFGPHCGRRCLVKRQVGSGHVGGREILALAGVGSESLRWE